MSDVLHEMMHALGMRHEFERPDYLENFFEKVNKAADGFDIKCLGGFDYCSNMQYCMR